MTDKTFIAVGITTSTTPKKGQVTKVRFSNNIVRRVKKLVKSDASRFDFVELPHPMKKLEALHYMLTRSEFSSAEDQATITDSIEDRTPKPKRPRGRPRLAVKPSQVRKEKRNSTTTDDILAVVE